jgi:CubicO group peptidase (beta-lactamase class C family)
MPVTDVTARRLRSLLAQQQVRGRVPSVVAALTRDGVLQWRGYHGETTGTDAAPHDLQFRIGSITKTMTAVLLLRLRDQHRLSLSDPLERFLPGVAYGDRTLRSLLSHASGLPAEPPGEWWERVEGVPFEQLRGRLDGGDAPFPDGSTYHYSNLAFGLLGEVVSVVTGTTWWEHLAETLLQPLGMLRTTYDPFEPHAQGWSVDPYTSELRAEPHTDTAAMAPAGQLWSTVMDLATFADFLLEGHREVLGRDTLTEMCTPQAGTGHDGLGLAYGLGVRLFPGGSGTLIGHTGSMPGFQAALLVDRERRTGAVTVANSTTGLRPADLCRDLADLLQADEPRIPPPWLPSASVPGEVRAVVGVWHWGNTALRLTWEEGRLRAWHVLGGETYAAWELVGGRLVGVSGHHHGEELRHHVDTSGSEHLTCSTLVMTRSPYDPRAPVPGEHSPGTD